MGVIINELDVVSGPPAEAGAQAAAPPSGSAAPPSPVNMEDLRTLLRHQAERAARLRAH